MNSLNLLPVWFVAFYIFIIGLCVGSFLNVVILRGLEGESFVFERSRCPKCKNQLKWYMNIPLLSYIFLRGKCAFCNCKISIQYPIIEAIVAILFLIIYFSFGLTLKTLFLWAIFALFVAMSTTDFKQTVIIDTHAYVLFALGLLYSYLGLGEVNLIQGLIGAFVGFAFFEIMARIGLLLSGCRMFGEGDGLIALGIGAIFGWKALLVIIALSILIQSISAIPILVFQAFKDKKIKLSISYVFVFLSILVLFWVNQINLINHEIAYFGVVGVITILLLWALKNIVAEIRNKKLDDSVVNEEKFCLLPFGPALIFASMICIFYFAQIKEYILNFIS